MAHVTVAGEASLEQSIQGSRFIAFVFEADSPESVLGRLASVRGDHPDATHHCWAFRVGPIKRFSDDGEPGGTAGRPMLEVVLKRGLDHVGGVVVRYYGGKKLGAGGLVRAYSGTLAKAFDLAGVREVVDVVSVRVWVPFAGTDVALRLLDELGRAEAFNPLVRGAPGFDERGMNVEVSVPASALAELEARLQEATNGAAKVEGGRDTGRSPMGA
ncbi:MAG: YigZ family protein [Trueperaceae bacterium]|nr:YigZ family protein [Trueperaceae bacterium]MCC6310568.1 YigZ family protein [Trueperaceae bacterium]